MNRIEESETGASLFKGESSIFVGVDDRQEEEEEELEDQKRRDQELQNLVANYIGNISFDDDGSVVSSSFDSTNTSRFKEDTRNAATDETEKYMETAYKDSSLYGNDQWQVLYQNAVREEKKLKEELERLKATAKSDIDTVNRKYYLAEAESRRMKILLEQSQAIVGEKTEAVYVQEKQIEDLSMKLKELEQTKQSLENEVFIWKSSSNDLEQKLHLMEKGLNSGVSEKQIRSHYETEINKLQSMLQNTNDKLEKFEKQCKELREEIAELEYVRSTLITQREEYMKEIEDEREEHRRMCVKLMQTLREIKNDALQNHDSFTNSEFKDASTQAILEECQVFLSKFRQDLKLIREKSSKEITNLQEICEKLKRELRSKRDVSTTKNYDHVISTLESELKRSISDQAQKRSEIEKLEELVKEMRKSEEELKAELRVRKDKESLSTEKYEEFLLKFRNDLKNSVDEQQALNNEIKILENRIAELKLKEDKLKKKIGRKSLELEHNEDDKLKEKIDEISKLKDKLRHHRENEEALKKELKSIDPEKSHDNNNDVLKLNKMIIELHSMNDQLKKDLKHLKSSCKGRPSLCKNAGQENSYLRQKIQELEDENKLLSAELREKRDKQKGSMESLDTVATVATNYADLEKGAQARTKIAEKKLLEAQNTISLLQSQLGEKRANEICLREQLASKSNNEEIVEDLVKKSAIFEEYMSNKTTQKVQEIGVQTENSEYYHNISIQTELTPFEIKKSDIMCVKCTQTSIIFASKSVQTEKMKKCNLKPVSCQTEPYETDSQVFNAILERRYKQLEGLLEENKNLKYKLQQDREAFKDLTNTWHEEMKHLTTALSEAFQSREELLKRITELSIEVQGKSEVNDVLSNQLTCLNEILNKYELAAAGKEKIFITENSNLRKSMSVIFETLLQRVTNCIMRADYAISTYPCL